MSTRSRGTLSYRYIISCDDIFQLKGSPSTFYISKPFTEDLPFIVADKNFRNVPIDQRPCFHVSNGMFEYHNTCAGQESGVFSGSWKDIQLLIINLDTLRADAKHTIFSEKLRDVCFNIFRYHCSGTTDEHGLGDGFFMPSWNESNFIALLITHPELAHQTRTSKCAFSVLSFCLFKTYTNTSAAEVSHKYQVQSRKSGLCVLKKDVEHDARNYVYISVVCSKFSMAQHIMSILCGKHTHGMKIDTKWKAFVFGNGAQHESHYVLLRAIMSVYTYYPIVYGFTRSVDNTLCPIFTFNIDNVRDRLKGHLEIKKTSVSPPRQLKIDEWILKADSPNNVFMENIFGDSTNDRGVVWSTSGRSARREQSVYNVYQLTKKFSSFLKDNSLHIDYATRWQIFFDQPMFVNDNHNNGYLYGLYVPAHQEHSTSKRSAAQLPTGSKRTAVQLHKASKRTATNH